MLLLLVIVMLGVGRGGEARPCGDPPQCACYPGVVDCREVDRMPDFAELETRVYRTMFLAGTMRRVPDLTTWAALATVDVQRTLIPCLAIRRWQQSAPFRVVARRCANMTGTYLIVT